MTTRFPIPAGHRLRLRLWPVVLLCGASAAALPGAELFRLFTRPLIIPERGAVTSYVLETTAQRCCFLPPADWVVNANASTREVVMMAPGLNTSIRFRVVPEDPEAPDSPGLENWRAAMLEEHPGARLVTEFPCYTGNGTGQAIDLERTAADRLKISTRLAVLPLPEGRVEFNLTTPAGQLTNYHSALGNLLTSFTVEPVRTKPTGTNLAPAPRKPTAVSNQPNPRSTADDEPGGRADGTVGAPDSAPVVRPMHSP